ncbi:MAG: hypothetical protein WCK27_14180 [Verrucomicrobiota bacterium]
MRTTLKISICVNCALLGCLAFLLLNGRPARHGAQAPAEAENPPPVAEAVMPAPGVSPTAEVQPFHWSQIESADYRTYVANLREIGCPEQTIRDLVKADVDSLYASRRQPLNDKLATGDAAGRIAVQRELQELGNQEISAVTALLAAPPAAANTTSALPAEAPSSSSVPQESAGTTLRPRVSYNAAPSASTPNTSASRAALEAAPYGSARQAPPAPISLPLVLQPVDPSVVNLNPQQAQVVDALRQKFIQDVGGPNQNPNDPAYSQRWQASQPQADLDLCGMLGIFAFQSYQIAAWAKANAQTTSNP